MKWLLFLQNLWLQSSQSMATLIKVALWSRPVKLPQPQHAEMVILGNGPSLKDFLMQPKDFFKNKDLMAVNHFADTDAFQELKPAYYMINVPEFWTDDIDDDVKDRRNRLYQNLIERTHFPLHLFLGIGAKKSELWQKLPQKNSFIKIHYINPTPVEGFQTFRFFCYQHLCGMPRPHNVLIPSLISAINMGYRKIYLLGADHSWLKDIYVAPDNRVFLTQKHFYDAKTAQPAVMKKLGKSQRHLHEILHKFMLSFKAYFDLDAYAQKQGCKIINLTPNSYIDAFKRQKL